MDEELHRLIEQRAYEFWENADRCSATIEVSGARNRPNRAGAARGYLRGHRREDGAVRRGRVVRRTYVLVIPCPHRARRFPHSFSIAILTG